MYKWISSSLSHLKRSFTKSIWSMMELGCLDQLEAHWDFVLDFQFLTRSVCLSILSGRSWNAPNLHSHTSQQSHYIEVAQGAIEIWAGFELFSSTEKNGPIMTNFWGLVFHVFNKSIVSCLLELTPCPTFIKWLCFTVMNK